MDCKHRSATSNVGTCTNLHVITKVPLSLRGGEGQFHLAACLPFAPKKFREFARFQQNLLNLTACEQIPEIPAKFRENFGEKNAI